MLEQKKNNKLSSNLISANKEKEQKEIENQQLVKQNEKLDKENGGLRDENGVLKTENGGLRDENGVLKTENGELKTEKGVLENKNGDLKTENGELELKNLDLNGDNRKLLNEFNLLKEKFKVVDAERANSNTSIEIIKTNFNDTINEINRKNDEITKLKNENVIANQKIKDLTAIRNKFFQILTIKDEDIKNFDTYIEELTELLKLENQQKNDLTEILKKVKTPNNKSFWKGMLLGSAIPPAIIAIFKILYLESK